MKPEETIDFHIRWAWHKIARFYNSEAAKYGFSMSVGYVLLNIDSKAGTPSTKLGPKMGMEPRSLTRTLKTMEESGLIYREADSSDKRVIRIHLTPLGKQKRDISRKTVIDFNTKVRDKLNGKLEPFLQTIEEINTLI
jgi:DNA-binding MarR family transcriptional regulator